MTDTKILRCVSWAAVSSQEQARGVSLGDQVKRNLEFIEKIPDIYPGYAGVLIPRNGDLRVTGSRRIIRLSEAEETHPAYAELTHLIRANAIDLLVCRSRDRLGRRGSLVMTIQALCSDHDVIVCPRDDRPPSLDPDHLRDDDGINVIIPALGAAISEASHSRVTRRLTEGVAQRVRNGQFPGRLPYGYRYAYRENGTRHIVAQEDELRTVRRIVWDWYTMGGQGFRRIVDQLNEQEIPAPAGGPWQMSSVRAILLRVERYAGIVEYGKVGRYQYTAARGDYPTIITDDELARIRAERSRRRRYWGGATRRVLTGTVYCAACKQPMVGSSRQWPGGGYSLAMRCVTPDCEEPTSITEEKIYTALREYILQVSSADLEDIDIDLPSETIDGLLADMATLEEERKQIERAQRKLLRAYAELEAVSEEHFVEQADEFKRRQERIQLEIAAKQREIEQCSEDGTLAERLEEVQASGLEMLELADEDPDMVRQWLQRHFRVWVARARQPSGRNRRKTRMRIEVI